MNDSESTDLPGQVHQVDEPRANSVYAWYVVSILTIAYICSFIDRQIPSLLVDLIKQDMKVNDTQMGLLMGTSFALFYTVLGIPFGMLSDRMSRRTLIGWGIAAWSVMTALCGYSSDYTQLFLARMGVGVGEATLGPAAYSLIADYFPKKRLATALSVYSMGIYIGSGLANTVGGFAVGWATKQAQLEVPYLGSFRSWQTIFIIVGLPGFLIALAMLTVKEPRRQHVSTANGGGNISIFTWLGQHWVALFCLSAGYGLIAMANYAAAYWIPALLVRVHGWPKDKAGVYYGIIVAVAGSLGIITGGRFADSLKRKGWKASNFLAGYYAAALALPLVVLYPLMPSGSAVLALVFPIVCLVSSPWGAGPAAVQEIMPTHLRGQGSAIFLFIVNIIGIGMGPPSIGFLNDHVFGNPNAVATSMQWTCGGSLLLGCIIFQFGLPYYRRLRQTA